MPIINKMFTYLPRIDKDLLRKIALGATQNKNSNAAIIIIDDMIKRGMRDFNSLLTHIAKNGHGKMNLNYMKKILGLTDKKKINFNNIFNSAALNKDSEIAECIIQWADNDFTNYDKLVMNAAKGNAYIFNKYINRFSNLSIKNLNKFTNTDLIEVIETAIKRGANNFNKIAIRASKNGNLDIIKLVISYGANNFEKMIKLSTQENHFHIPRYIFKNDLI
jgi:hypothetical protein